MQHEAEEKSDEQSNRFRDELFAHAFVNQNPDMFRTLYPEVFGVEDESIIEWEIPENEVDFEEMMDELHSTGWNS